MKQNFGLLDVLLVVLLFLGACAGPSTQRPGPAQPDRTIDRRDSDRLTQRLTQLVEQLRDAGAAVEMTDERFSQPFFSVPAQVLTLNGQGVQVFAYESQAAAEAEATLVAPGGGAVGTHKIRFRIR